MKIEARILAGICLLLAAFPSLLLPTSLMWAYSAFTSSIHAVQAYPGGTSSFFEGQYDAICQSLLTFVLDIAACIALWGWIAIVVNLLSRRWTMVIWILAIVSGFGLAITHGIMVGTETKKDFVTMFVIIPAGIGVISLIGLFLAYSHKESPHALSR